MTSFLHLLQILIWQKNCTKGRIFLERFIELFYQTSLHCNFVTTFTSVSKHHLDTCLLYILQRDFNLAEKLRKKKEKVGFSFAIERTVKLIYSEEATEFCEISTNYLSYVLTASQKIGGDFAKFCGLFTIYELHLDFTDKFWMPKFSKVFKNPVKR